MRKPLRDHRGCRHTGFTLLEVMVAVLIIGMLALTLNRFVASTLTALRVSRDQSSERAALVGLMNLLQAQLIELPAGKQNVLLGQPHKFGEFSTDSMEWAAKPGVGTVTSAATGDYRVSLELKPVTKGSAALELGLRRVLDDSVRKQESWLPLMSGLKGLRIRYFHPQLRATVDRWNDPNLLPPLVTVEVWPTQNTFPYKAVLALPAANLQK